MANSEDYLDSLLNSVTKKLSEFDEDFEQKKDMADPYRSRRKLPPRTQKALDQLKEDEFLQEFEQELLMDDDAEDFLSAFEEELSAEADAFDKEKEEETVSDAEYFEQMESIVSEAEGDNDVAAPEQLGELENFDLGALSDALDLPEEPLYSEESSNLEQPANMDASTGSKTAESDLLSELSLDDLLDGIPSEAPSASSASMEDTARQMVADKLPGGLGDLTLPEGMEGLGDLFEDEVILPEDDEGMSAQELDQLLSELPDDEALSDIGKMLEADENDIELEDISAEPESLQQAAEAVKQKTKSKKEKKTKKPNNNNAGFMKFMNLLFGEDEELEEDLMAIGNEALGSLSDENQQILSELDKENAKSAKKAKKEKKKKEKEEAKKAKEEKPKKEKIKKEKPPKQPKQPKVKGPKEKPLPRKPVLLIWGIALTIFAIVYFGASNIHYASTVKAANEKFDQGLYVEAYGKLQHLEIKDRDLELYNKVCVLAGIQSELDAYYALMEVSKYDLALDCLIRGLGHYDAKSFEAEEWNVVTHRERLGDELVKQLEDQFNVSEDEARAIYDIKDREEYSLALEVILVDLGLQEKRW